ncbi:MAG: cobalamin biosynthesis protein CbiA [Acidobacteriota bacterium]
MFASRVTVIVGHFGSGKTEIAVNGAVRLARAGETVALVDLDVVKPYFRSRSAREYMAGLGVRVVAPVGEYAHADLPIVLPEVRGVLRDRRTKVIVDVGGDPIGTRALGSISDAVPRGETEHLLVLNFRRPYTGTVEDAVTMVHEIEAAARLPVTGLISNSHLLGETSPEVVVEGYRMAVEAGRRMGLPVVAVAVDRSTHAQLVTGAVGCELLPLDRLIKPPFEGGAQRRRIGPLFVLN